MNYFYNLDGQNRGPVSLEELHDLARRGVIRTKTPVIEQGGSQWSRYGQLTTPEAGSPLPPAVPPASLFARLLEMNPALDRMTARLFRLPSVVPRGDEEKLRQMNRLAGIAGLAIWAAQIVVALGMAGSPAAGDFPAAAFLLVGLLVGFAAQYVAYQMYIMTNSLIIGQKIALSSLGFPRLLGALFLIGSLALLFALLTASGSAAIFSRLCGLLVCVASCYLCFNAEELTVSVEPGKVSPGREFNNVIRFLLRNFFAVLHLLAPVLMILAALGLAVSLSGSPEPSSFGPYRSSPSPLDTLGANLLLSFLIYVPLFNFIGLCLTSWLFDLFDAFFSPGGND